MSYTIAEDFTLPSLGKLYSGQINPHIKLRSMTVEEEMKRLTPSETPYKTLCDIIDDCTVESCGISSYDMCLGDFQYLLHRLRVVTYGSEYKLTSTCPFCGTPNEVTLNLDSIKVLQYDDYLQKYFKLTLPVSKKEVELKYQTPRIADNITQRKKEIIKRTGKTAQDQSLLLEVSSLIKTIDGKAFNPITQESFIRKLPMRDINKILNYADKINKGIGIDTNIPLDHCSYCDLPYKYPFRITPEFFRPSEDE